MSRNLVRHNDLMIAVESAPATIDFQDILDAAQVVHDDCSDAPWENCDGFEHTATRESEMAYEADAREMQGSVYCDGRRERIVIELPAGEDYGIYEYLRQAGASKQVAREAVAAERRRTIARLADWYANGWQWYGVKCEFEILGVTYEDSIWGIDDEDYAERDVRNDVALEVAAQLEAAGFTVIGQPNRGDAYKAHRLEVVKDRHARNLASQNWRD